MRHLKWLSLSVIPLIGSVEQPLWDLVADKALIGGILAGATGVPSCRVHSLGAGNGCG